MDGRERTFALTISGVHGVDHFLKRLFPPLVPVWALAFGFPLWKLGLLLGAHSLGSAIGQAPMGEVSDRYDRRYLLPTGIAVMGAAICVFAVIPYLPALDVGVTLLGYDVGVQFVVLLLAMLATGLGSSTVHPTGYPLITANVSPERKGKVLGMWGSASKFGDGAAPALVGALLIVTGWNEILLAFGALGIAYAAWLFVLLGGFETRPAARVPTTAESGETASEGTASDDGGVSWRTDRRIYLYPMLAVFAYFVIQIMAAGGVNVFIPEFVNSVYGYSFAAFGIELTAASTASFYYSALLIIAGVAQLGTGELADRYDYRALILIHLVVASLALLALATLALSPVGLFAVLVVLGVSLFAVNPARDALVSEITPEEREGRTFGYLWTGALLAASASAPIVGYIGDVAGLRNAFAIIAGVILLSAVPIALLLSDRVYVAGEDRGDASRAD